MSKRFLLPILSLLLLSMAWSGYWLWASGELREALDGWEERQARDGREVAYGERHIEGFPLHLRLRFESPEIRDARGWHWAGPRLVGEASLWDPRNVRFDFSGQHEVTAPDGRSELSTIVTTTHARAEADLDRRGRAERLHVDLAGLEISGGPADGAAAEALEVRLGPRVRASDEEPERLDYFVSASRVLFPDNLRTPLGNAVTALEVEGTLEGEVPLGPVEYTLAAWRDAGGILQLHHLHLDHGPLRMDGDGTATLDASLRPIGAGRARFRGLEETIEALSEAGSISSNAASAVKLGILLATRRNEETGEPEVELPISAQDGWFHLGPVPVLPLSPWVASSVR